MNEKVCSCNKVAKLLSKMYICKPKEVVVVGDIEKV